MDKASESVLALKPVTFRYKNDNRDTPQFGLIAEQVAEVNPRPGRARRKGQDLHGPLRRGERDVAQRVSQRAQKTRRTAGDDCAIKIERWPSNRTGLSPSWRNNKIKSQRLQRVFKT